MWKDVSYCVPAWKNTFLTKIRRAIKVASHKFEYFSAISSGIATSHTQNYDISRVIFNVFFFACNKVK